MTTTRFSKFHGIGNDFVMLADPDDDIELTPGLVRALCDRRFGIGGDGVIRAVRSPDADLFMDYYNSDGSVGEMCGNGIRCLALFARDEGLVDTAEIAVMTRAGLKPVTIEGDGRVRVDMGAPIFQPEEIPVRWPQDDALHAKIELDQEVVEAACVSMGNPHAVLLHPDPPSAPVTSLGPAIERHPLFPKGTNVEFMRVDAVDRITMRVWERGSGETLACGTGAAAVAVVARVLHGVSQSTTVTLPGGDLDVEWAGAVNDPQPVYITGPAVRAYDGDIDLSEVRST